MSMMKWTLSGVMLAAAFAGIAPSADAQTPQYRGSFKLPFEARFGNVVLPAGSYTVSTLDGAKGIRIRGENGNVSLLAAASDAKPETERARLILVDSGGMYALRSFESGSMGVELQFLVVKHAHGAVERAALKPTIEVGLQ